MAKSAGFMNRSDDSTLEQLGLLSCDILYHYWQKSFDELHRAWCPLLFAGDLALIAPLQRMSALLPSTVSEKVKMKEAQRVADDFAAQAIDTNPGRNKKVPKVLGLIKQRRLAAREEVQAVMHTLSLAGLELRKPERILRPPDLKSGETRLTDASLGPMLWHTESGAAQWDVVLPEDLQELRVVLAPDEGGPLWNVHADILADASQASPVENSSCGPIVAREWPKANEDDALMQLFAPSILKELLVLVLGPWLPSSNEGGGDGEKFDKIVDLCIRATQQAEIWLRALVDDFAHDLFLVMDFQSEIFRELCIHLASRPFLDTSELFWGFVRRLLVFDSASTRLTEVVFRRSYMKQLLLLEHLETTLSCCSELESYRRHMTRAPHSTAALLAPSCRPDDLQPVQKDLLEDLKVEWNLVLFMESKTASASLLHSLCPYVLHQNYREIMSTLNAANFSLSSAAASMIEAWHPALSQSSNVEDIFNSCEDAVRRTKAGAGTMPNLSTVAMRALVKKVCNSEGQARTVQLEASDFEGPEVQGLKPKLFTPESCTAGFTAGTITTAVFF
eukprot:s1198_g3.t1